MRRLIALLLLANLAPLGAHAAEAPDAKALHAANCTACHASRFGGDANLIYTRSDRRVQSLTALGKQVRFCKDTIGLTWFDEEVNGMIDYLNTTYYHFPTDK